MTSGSRIEAVETVLADGGWHNYVFVRITTEDGLTGIGEATLEYHEEVVARQVADYAELLRGMEAGRIEHIWQRLYRSGFWRGGPVLMSALGGIDQALWDLKGKAAQMPVYDLLGGRVRDDVRLYANGPRGDDAAAIAEDARRIVQELGFPRLKIPAWGPSLGIAPDAAMRRTVEIVSAIREQVGPDIAIGVDIHGRYNTATVIQLATALEPFGIWFFEEPALPENPAQINEIARRISIPVATGERLHSRWDYQPLLAAGLIAIVQPDLGHCGGISEGRRIAALADVHRMGVAPHNPMSPVNTAASAHLAMATHNFVALEYLVNDVPWRDDLVDHAWKVSDGVLHVPDAPGLGIELNMDTCAAHPPKPVTRFEYRQPDGTVAEW